MSFTQDKIKNTKCVCLDDYRQLARIVLPKQVFIYIDSGSSDEITLQNNVKAFRQLVFFPRVLRDSFQLDLRSSLFGSTSEFPLGFAPWAMNKLTNQIGQKGTIKVAAKYNLPFILSTLTNVHPKQLSALNPNGLKFQQLYLCNDWSLNQKLVKIAEQSNFQGLVITVDAQVLGSRKKQQIYKLDTSKYEFPLLQQITKASNEGPKQRVSYLKNRDLSLNWESLQRIRKMTSLKIIIKGILHPKDAELAIKYCDAIYISNHGGRQLDTVPATIEILPRISAAVRKINKEIPILIDGGVRTGNDIFKCLALGANFVFVGRPLAYSLIQGQEGVENMVDILRDQLRRCMILNGVKSIKQISPEYIGFRSKI